jgi:hypothetical protein
LTLKRDWPVDFEVLGAIEGSNSEEEMVLSSELPVHASRKRSIGIEVYVLLKVKESITPVAAKDSGRPGVEPESIDSERVSVKILVVSRAQLRNDCDQAK